MAFAYNKKVAAIDTNISKIVSGLIGGICWESVEKKEIEKNSNKNG